MRLLLPKQRQGINITLRSLSQCRLCTHNRFFINLPLSDLKIHIRLLPKYLAFVMRHCICKLKKLTTTAKERFTVTF